MKNNCKALKLLPKLEKLNVQEENISNNLIFQSLRKLKIIIIIKKMQTARIPWTISHYPLLSSIALEKSSRQHLVYAQT